MLTALASLWMETLLLQLLLMESSKHTLFPCPRAVPPTPGLCPWFCVCTSTVKMNFCVLNMESYMCVLACMCVCIFVLEQSILVLLPRNHLLAVLLETGSLTGQQLTIRLD